MAQIYYEPNAAPEEVIKAKEKEKRVIKIRFDSREDLVDFVNKTGISIPHKKKYSIFFDGTVSSLE